MTPEELAAKLARATIDRQRLMSRIVFRVLANSQRWTPVRTGNLRRSETGRVEAAGQRGVVGTNVRYAPAVHRRRPFCRQGMAASRESILAELRAAGESMLSEVAG